MAQAVFSRPSSGCHTKAYRRRRPEETVLYQTVEAHWPEFRERAEEAGGLPRFVVREFEQYLQCGRLEHGCLHLVSPVEQMRVNPVKSSVRRGSRHPRLG